jgi:DNA-binding MarR family transcriptional regulator
MTSSPSSSTTYTVKPGSLLQRGNYALFRILTEIALAGNTGITTVALHSKLGTHSNRTNAIIRKAEQLGLIERRAGARPGPGQFAPLYNIITERGKLALQTMRL